MALYSDRVSNLKIEKATSQENSVLASWSYPSSPDHFKDFKVTWYFGITDNGRDVWQSSETTINSHSIHNNLVQIPSYDLTRVKTVRVYVEVTPEASNKKVAKYNKKGKKTGTTNEPAWKGVKQKSSTLPIALRSMYTPSVPPVPTVTKVGDKLKVSITNYLPETSHAASVRLQCRLNESDSNKVSHVINLKNGTATYTSGKMTDGVAYQWRAIGYSDLNGNGIHSGASEWSGVIVNKPNSLRENSFIMQTAKRENSNDTTPIPNLVIKDYNNKWRYIDSYVIMWSADPNDIKYNSPKGGQKEFSKGDPVKEGGKFFWQTDHVYVRCYLPEITEYARANNNTVYVYVRAKYGESYSDYQKDVRFYVKYNAGTKPLPPTVWTSKSTYTDDEKISINWVNNTTDGSFQSEYDLEITYFNVVRHITKTTSVPLGESEPTYSISFNTINDITKLFNDYPGFENMNPGTYNIRYRLRVKCQYGIETPSVGWSDWTVYKEFVAYQRPKLEFEHYGLRSWYWDPFDFRYDTIYTAYDGSPFPSDPDYLEHFPIFIGVVSSPVPQMGLEYSFTITALNDYETLDYDGNTRKINSGEVVYTKISPPTRKYWGDDTGNYCLVRIDAWDILLENGIQYLLTATVTMDSGLTAQTSTTFTTRFEDASFLPDADIVVDDELYTAYIEPKLLEPELEPGEEPLQLEDVVFNIFRRNYDGTMTEIAKALNGDDVISVVDPHPALNGASYRIIGMSKKTGEIQYVDKPGQEFSEKPIIIQWDDNWQPYDLLEDYIDEAEDEKDLMLYGQGYQGNILKLPFNIDISNGYDIDKELVSYIGRENPVSYYGTAKGETMSLSTEIPKSSADIIYGLRKLSRYAGNCYIREPNGTGYWANVTVSFNINHLEVKVPVSITATRVEGGI